MNLLKRLFSKKNKNSKLSDIEVNSKPKIENYFTNADTNNMNKNTLLNEIYIEDITNNNNHRSTNANSSLKSDEVPLDITSNSGTDSRDAFDKSVDTVNTHYDSTDIDAVSSTGTDSTITVKDITSVGRAGGSINDNTCHGTTINTIQFISNSNDKPLQSNHVVPNLGKGACNIDSVTGVEDILNKIIKELNNIIIQRERLRRKLKLRENSYKLIKKKFNTVLNNKLYKPIKLVGTS